MVSFEIDGQDFSTLEGFYEEATKVLFPRTSWGRNLDAFNDVLRGGFGTPEEGFEIVWRNHALSKERLGHPETVRQLEQILRTCHPSNRESVRERIRVARAGSGPTVFDWLKEIIESHGSGGDEEQDNVVLTLR
jgi:RNAse (barnase) inhibitor barstar